MPMLATQTLIQDHFGMLFIAQTTYIQITSYAGRNIKVYENTYLLTYTHIYKNKTYSNTDLH